jgi:hypothetical protein
LAGKDLYLRVDPRSSGAKKLGGGRMPPRQPAGRRRYWLTTEN